MYLDVPYNHDEAVDVTGDECSRAWEGPCEGELFDRVSRSGLTVSTICEGHAASWSSALTRWPSGTLRSITQSGAPAMGALMGHGRASGDRRLRRLHIHYLPIWKCMHNRD